MYYVSKLFYSIYRKNYITYHSFLNKFYEIFLFPITNICFQNKSILVCFYSYHFISYIVLLLNAPSNYILLQF